MSQRGVDHRKYWHRTIFAIKPCRLLNYCCSINFVIIIDWETPVPIQRQTW